MCSFQDADANFPMGKSTNIAEVTTKIIQWFEGSRVPQPKEQRVHTQAALNERKADK
jgi:hypothetical protein